MTMQTARFLENYNRLKAVLGEEQTQVLTAYFADQFDESRREQEMQVATKIDLANLKIELSEKIGLEASQLSSKISDSKVESIKWIVALMITQTGLLTGIIFAIVKHWF